jgi:tetratricopeptide (TPR) repeat protein
VRRAIVVAAWLVIAAAPALAQAPAPGRILVVPFENTAREPRLHWMSEAAAVLLADALNARGASAITRAERVRAFEQLHLPAAASLSRATVIKVGQIVGASEVIVGSFALEGEDLVVSAHSVRIDVGRLQPVIAERSPLPGLFGLFDRVAQRLTPARPSTTNRDPQPPLDAFENYIKGLVAESPATQATFLETAVEQYPDYDRARLALWDVRTDQGDHAAALAAVSEIEPESRLARRARFASAISLLELSRFGEAFETFKALIDDSPVLPAGSGAKPGAAVLNNLGVVQLRRGGTPETGTALYYLTRAADADPGDPDYLFNLGYAYLLERNNQGAIYWLRETVRRDPTDAEAHYLLAAALQASGSTVEAGREKELARQLSPESDELDRRAAADKQAVPKGLERVRLELDTSRALRPEQAIVNSAQKEQRDLATFHMDRGRRLFDREEDREAMAELRRAVYLSPYEAQAHLLIGRIHLRGGRPQEAVDALKISIWSADSEAARIAIAEAYLKLGKTPQARTELERALVLNPQSDAARKLLADIR